ncbi:MAG: phosphotransferase [Holophagaceae bacterium]
MAQAAVPRVDRARLQDRVEGALGVPGAVVTEWRQEPLPEWSWGDATAGLYRFRGLACAGAARLPWRLVLKVVRDPGDGFAWRTESDLYASGALRGLPGPVRAPACHGVEVEADGTAWIWLEDVPAGAGADRAWDPPAFRRVARALGRFNVSVPVPPAGGRWLRGAGLRGHVLHRDGPAGVIAREDVWRHPDVRRRWPASLKDRLLGLWSARDRLLNALEGLPEGFLHGDLHPLNLVPVPSDPGREAEWVLLDWAQAGRGPLGADAASLVGGALATFRADPREARDLDRAAFEGHVEGLRDGGHAGEVRELRKVHCTAASLLWALPVAARALWAAVEPGWRDLLVWRAGRSYDDLLAQRGQALDFLLGLGEEALSSS